MGDIFGSKKKSSSESAQTGSFNQTGTTNQKSGYNQTATFNPQAQGAIDALSGNFGSFTGGGTDAAQTFLTSMLGQGGGMNPYAQQVVDANNAIANKDFNKRLAGVRSSGYGGGIGRDQINQGMFASDYTNQQNYNNSRLMLDAFSQGQDRQLGAAGALGGLDANSMAAAIQFINSLRGEQGTAQQTGTEVAAGTSKANSTARGKESGFGLNLGIG
jgi:hypothetical protein